MNRDKILCGSFGLYPSFVARILNSVNKIHLYVLCNEQPNYADYIEKCIADKECCVCYESDTGKYIRLSCGSELIALSFETRLIHGQLPSELIFAQGVLKSTIIVSGLWHCVG
jgi:hypothetical protein